MYLLSSLPQLNVATTGAAICDQIFSLVTNIPCFSLIKILLLVTTCKSENLGVSWPQGVFLNVKPCIVWFYTEPE